MQFPTVSSQMLAIALTSAAMLAPGFSHADEALNRLEVDRRGLDNFDRRYLKIIMENYNGGPVGVETLSAALGEPRDAIEEIIEPYLLQEGFVQRTPRGRMAAAMAYSHLGLAVPKSVTQQSLFDAPAPDDTDA